MIRGGSSIRGEEGRPLRPGHRVRLKERVLRRMVDDVKWILRPYVSPDTLTANTEAATDLGRFVIARLRRVRVGTPRRGTYVPPLEQALPDLIRAAMDFRIVMLAIAEELLAFSTCPVEVRGVSYPSAHQAAVALVKPILDLFARDVGRDRGALEQMLNSQQFVSRWLRRVLSRVPSERLVSRVMAGMELERARVQRAGVPPMVVPAPRTTTAIDRHPLQNVIDVDPESMKAPHVAWRALISAPGRVLTSAQFREVHATTARGDDDAVRAVYASLLRAFPATAPWLGFRRKNDKRKIEAAIYLRRREKTKRAK